MLAALRRYGAPVAQHGVTAADLATEGTVYQVGLPPRRIDVLTRLDGVGFEEVWNGRLEHDLAGIRVAFIGRAELIRNKAATGRPRDQLDLLALAEAQGDR